MPIIDHSEDYYNLVLRNYHQKNQPVNENSYTIEERMRILEFQRINRLFSPQVTMIHGSVLLQKPGKLGDDVWVIYEQVCMAALHLGLIGWSAHCIDKLNWKFSDSRRVKRIYALYRETVGEWDEASNVYKTIIKENPENTFSRKRTVIMKRQQGRVSEAVDSAINYLTHFGTDKEVWHELAEIYLEQARLPQAMFCFEDLFLQDSRNMYYIITYGELCFSLNQCPEHIEIARKYFCLALQIDETNLRALWDLFFCSISLYKRDQGAEKILQLQTMCANRIRNMYKNNKSKSSEIMLELLDQELKWCEDSVKKKAITS